MKKLKKWQIVLIVILALGVIGALAGRGDEEKKNGIAVALLRKPVIWDGFEVNIVLMFALHKSFDQVPKLYDLILNVFDDPIRFAQVLECDSYTAFMKKIHIT